jgi:hypothetical protein
MLDGFHICLSNIDVNQNAMYPDQIQLNHPWLIEKCRNIRMQIKNIGHVRCRKMENFFQNTGGVRFSDLFRRMRIGAQDASTPGSPSYFSRRRDGIPTPALICSRKNTKIWTNEKQFLWMV